MKILEAVKIKSLTYKKSKIRIITNFSSESIQDGRQQDNILSARRKKST